MSDFSLQAVQFIPRFTAVFIYLSITLLVAVFAKTMVYQASDPSKLGETKRWSKVVANLMFWVIILVMTPFLLSVSGLDANWLGKAQGFVREVFSNWPLLMLMSVALVVISHLVRSVPKLKVHSSRSTGTASKKLQN